MTGNKEIFTKTGEIIDTIKDYKYVSFDIFDTLLKRNVKNPSDLFLIIEKKGKEIFGSDFVDFSKNRQNSEKDLWAVTCNSQIKFEDIYKQEKLNKLSISERKWAIEEEKKLEYKYCTINYFIKPVYDFCVNNHIKVEIISDMYLPQSLIEKMLKKIGINTWDHLWLSSTVNKTKFPDGDLFKYVLSKLKISNGEIVHIGDNVKSDIYGAKKCGIKAIQISTFRDNISYYNREINCLNDSIAREYINNNINTINSKYRLGYENMGPLLYGFSQWLLGELKNKGITKVYFCSRDGFIMKKAFDLINNKDSLIKSYYFYTSRRELEVPLLSYTDITFSSYIKHMYWDDYFNLKHYLKLLGLEEPELQINICNKFHLTLDTVFSKKDLIENKLLKEIFDDNLNSIRLNAKREKENLIGYIKQSDMQGKVAIVDIGWFGHMQLNLDDLIKREKLNITLFGYYMGLYPNKKVFKPANMLGYCFDSNENIEKYNIEVKVNFLFEEIFLAEHGSVQCIHKGKNKFMPKLYKFEQNDDNTISLLKEYQNGALLFIKQITSDLGMLYISSGFAIDGVLKQFINPIHEDAIKWGKIIFQGSREEQIVQGDFMYTWWKHPIRAIKDYRRSLWHEGYLSIYFDKDKLNYYRLTEILDKCLTNIYKITH